MARQRQGALGLMKLLQMAAIQIWIGIFIVLFWRLGGEACEVLLIRLVGWSGPDNVPACVFKCCVLCRFSCFETEAGRKLIGLAIGITLVWLFPTN